MASYLPRKVNETGPPIPGIIGSSPAMEEVYRTTRRVARSNASVLLLGETGTGKELIATAIHQLSNRATGPFVRVNCGALSESLLESELFGHVHGAFTGAIKNRTGSLRGGPHRHDLPGRNQLHLRACCRSSCCACCRNASSNAWATRRRFRSTCG